MRRLVEYVSDSKPLVALCMVLTVVEFLPCVAYFHDLYVQNFTVPFEPLPNYQYEEMDRPWIPTWKDAGKMTAYMRHLRNTPYATLFMKRLQELPKSSAWQANLFMAVGLIEQRACIAAWNYHSKQALEAANDGSDLSRFDIRAEYVVKISSNNKSFFKYQYEVPSIVENEPLCGQYFVPEGESDAGRIASYKELSALAAHADEFRVLRARLFEYAKSNENGSYSSKNEDVLKRDIYKSVSTFADEVQTAYEDPRSPFWDIFSDAYILVSDVSIYNGEDQKPNSLYSFYKILLGANSKTAWKLREEVIEDNKEIELNLQKMALLRPYTFQ